MRTQPIVPHHRNYFGWHRTQTRKAYERSVPGQVLMIEPSLFQPVNVPAKIQVDQVGEYAPPGPFLGVFGYVERTPYVQTQPVQQPRPQYPFTVQPPRFSVLPVILGVKGTNG
jgi:hypothetical protein